jgi:2-hydroxychromene-2-carboxylate isomerase
LSLAVVFVLAMGDLIDLSSRRRAIREGSVVGGGVSGRRSRADRAARVARTPPAFFFDVGCPFSYLAAERVERMLGTVAWIPAASVELYRGEPWSDPDACARARARAEARAAELRLPLIWPERFPGGAPMALRAAAHAAEIGAGAAFALAAVRLAYCGGFDLEDPEILAEAAAAAGMKLEVCLAAAGDQARDGKVLATARGLTLLGVDELPAVRVGGRYIAGERRLAEAAAILRASSRGRRVAPGG